MEPSFFENHLAGRDINTETGRPWPLLRRQDEPPSAGPAAGPACVSVTWCLWVSAVLPSVPFLVRDFGSVTENPDRTRTPNSVLCEGVASLLPQRCCASRAGIPHSHLFPTVLRLLCLSDIL